MKSRKSYGLKDYDLSLPWDVELMKTKLKQT